MSKDTPPQDLVLAESFNIINAALLRYCDGAAMYHLNVLAKAAGFRPVSEALAKRRED